MIKYSFFSINSLFLLMILMFLSFMLGNNTFAFVTKNELPITNDSYYQGSPSIDGDRIVWLDSRNGNPDIYMYTIGTGVEKQITATPIDEQDPVINGDKIVWVDTRNGNRDIYMYDIQTEVEKQITTNSNDQFFPDISGDKIVWMDDRNSGSPYGYNNSDIYMYDIATGIESQITDFNGSESTPAIDGDRVVYSSVNDIYLYTISTGAKERITPANWNQSYMPDIKGDRIVWVESQGLNHDIYMYDISTGSVKQITNSAANQDNPVVYGNKIVYEDYRNSHYMPSIYMYDVSTGVETQIAAVDLASYQASKWAPQIDGDRIIWEDWRGNVVNDIYMYQITDQIPPTSPNVNEITDQSTTVSGTADPGSTVMVIVDYLGLRNKGIADESGNFTVEVPALEAERNLTVIALDDAGNMSEAKLVSVKDVTAPSMPSVDEVSNMSTKITGSAERDSIIAIKAGNQLIKSITTNTEGKFATLIPSQRAGITLSITSKDKAGNISESLTVTVLDKVPPRIPTINPISDRDSLITGTSEATTKIYAMDGERKIGEAIALNGRYMIGISKPTAGKSILVYAIDEAGNKSKSQSVIITDKTPPSIPIIDRVTSKTTMVTGKAEAGSTVFINKDSKIIGYGVVNNQGAFKIKINPQRKDSVLQINVQDPAGNTSKSIMVKVY